MTQRLHLVFGGELMDPQGHTFRDISKLETVGYYPNYETAYDAWKAVSHASVDNAHMCYFIAHLHRLRDESIEASATEEMD